MPIYHYEIFLSLGKVNEILVTMDANPLYNDGDIYALNNETEEQLKTIAINKLKEIKNADGTLKYPGVENMTYHSYNSGSNPTSTISNTTPTPTPTPTPTTTPTPSGDTLKLGPDTDDLKKKAEDMEKQINDMRKITVPSTSEIGEMIWKNSIEPKLLTVRQICKKVIMMQGQTYTPPIDEERAQLIVYGKVYQRKPELPTDTILTLWDNDSSDPNCVSKSTDEDYLPPLDEKSPLWQDILKKKDELKKSLQEVGIKLGEMVIAQPTAIIEITSSLISMASSAVIMPPGSGLPVAFAALQTMMNSIRKLQSKTGEILPYLTPLQYLSLVLPASAQAIVATITAIITVYLTVIALIGKIVEALLGLVAKLGSSASKQPTQEFSIKPEASSNAVSPNTSLTLKAGANGGSWQYQYEWIEYAGPDDITGRVIPSENTKDDGTRTVTPGSDLTGVSQFGFTTYSYQVKVTDSDTKEVKTSDLILVTIGT